MAITSDGLKFHLDQLVYHKVRPSVAGMVTGITYRTNGVLYEVTWSNDLQETSHAESELTTEKKFKHDAD